VAKAGASGCFCQAHNPAQGQAASSLAWPPDSVYSSKMTFMTDTLQKWVTLVASVLAAVASGWNLWWKYREGSDKIKVVYGLIDPQLSPGDFLHVVSLCDHPIRIADYGYVMRTGKLLSIPQLDADEPNDDERIIYGSRLLESRNASFETGRSLRKRPVGVYARTTSQSRPQIAFQDDTPTWMRYWLYLKIRMKVVYD